MPESIQETIAKIEGYRQKRQLYQMLHRYLGLLVDDTLEHQTLPYGVPKAVAIEVIGELKGHIEDLELEEGLALTERAPVVRKKRSEKSEIEAKEKRRPQRLRPTTAAR